METEEEEVNMELEEYNHHVEASTPEEEEEHEDPSYEFDAPRYYDFAQTETHLQALEAERWFDSAESYPPSRMYIFIFPAKRMVIAYVCESNLRIPVFLKYMYNVAKIESCYRSYD